MLTTFDYVFRNGLSPSVLLDFYVAYHAKLAVADPAAGRYLGKLIGKYGLDAVHEMAQRGEASAALIQNRELAPPEDKPLSADANNTW